MNDFVFYLGVGLGNIAVAAAGIWVVRGLYRAIDRSHVRALSNNPCPACGAIMSSESAKKVVDDASVISPWHVTCPTCHAALAFIPSSGKLKRREET